jgi:tetratricopeptide (TPR) repeat protein
MNQNVEGVVDNARLRGAKVLQQIEVRPAVEAAICLQPDADAYGVLAAARLGQGDHEGALRANLEALRLNPEFPQAWHNLGQTYLEIGQFEKAATSFEQVFQLGTGIPNTHYLLGLAYLKLGNFSAALDQCQLLRSLDSNKEQDLRAALSTAQLSRNTSASN